MKKAKAKIKQYGDGISIVDSGALNAQIFKLMCVIFFALALAYIAVLSTMIFNIIERKSLDSQYRILSNEVGELESSYLKEAEKIDLAFSQSLGFRNIEKEFATPVSLGLGTPSHTALQNEL